MKFAVCLAEQFGFESAVEHCDKSVPCDGPFVKIL